MSIEGGNIICAWFSGNRSILREVLSSDTENKEKWIENIDITISGWFSANICSMLGAILTKLQDELNTVTIDARDSKDILERISKSELPKMTGVLKNKLTESIYDNRYWCWY